MFIGDTTRPHKTHIAYDFLEEKDIRGIGWTAICPDLSSTEHVCDDLGRAIAPPRILQELKPSLFEECYLLPQALLDPFSNKATARSAACIAVLI